MNWKASFYIRAIIGLAAIAAATAVGNWRSADPGLFALCAVLALIANTWKIQIPKVQGNVSAGFVFLLIAMGQFSWSEAVFLAGASALVQSLFRKKTPPKLIQAAFNTSALILVAGATHWFAHWAVPSGSGFSVLVRLVLAGVVMFLLNSLAVALVLYLMGQVDFGGACRQIQIWVAPYYATGGVVAAAAVEANLLSAAWTGLPVLPLIIVAYLYYKGSVETIGQATQASN